MNRLLRLAFLFLLMGCLPASAQRITLTLTVTNRAVTSNSFTANGSVRVFTNVTAALTVATNLTSINATKTNLFNQIASFPFTGVTLSDGNTNAGSGTNSFRLFSSFGGALSGSVTGTWGYVTLSTQAGPITFPMLYPVANIINETNRTNQASDVISALDTFATNRFGTNFNGPLSNYLNKGASPVQAISSPVQFNGRVGIGGSLNATNGFDSGRTNINPVTSNLVNYGNAIRSEGSGGNSFQAGSNALSGGNLSLAVGNNSLATNAETTAVGIGAQATNSYASAFGSVALAYGSESVAVGRNAQSTTNAGIAIGSAALASRYAAIALGQATETQDRFGIGIGSSATVGPGGVAGIGIGNSTVVSAAFGVALGSGAQATHSNSAAIGPPDHTGAAVTTTDTNQVRLGTANHHVSIPGFLRTEGGASNFLTVAGSTNVMRGSFNYPRFDLTTLAAGNNISVPFGTNRFIRCTGGPASAATICGIVGAATSGGLDGQDCVVFNDTGFTLTFAVNTVDPVAANRINTPAGTDVSIADQAWAKLFYDGTDSRWKLNATYPIQASATNALASLSTNGVQVTGSWTNLNLIYGSNVVLRATNTSGNVDLHISATDISHLFTITNDVIITNRSGPISVLSNLLGTATLPANFWQPGMSIEIQLWGKYFATGTLTQSNSVYYGANLLATNSMPYFGASGDSWNSEVTITCRTIGASGSLYCHGLTHLASSANGVSGVSKPVRLISGAVTVDTTAATALDYQFTPGATTTALHIHAGTAKVTP